MPEFSFDLNLGSLFAPVLLVVLAWIVRTAQKAVERRQDELHAETADRVDGHHKETSLHLDRIEAVATEAKDLAAATNGRVNALELDVAWLKGRAGEKAPSR